MKSGTPLSRKELKGTKGGYKCPKPGTVYCLDVYQPVVCPDGNVYGNSCYAWVDACQTGCTPYGGDLM